MRKQAQDGSYGSYGGHGVWVPLGMTAAEIMIGASVLSERFEVEHYEARSMVRAVLSAIRAEPRKAEELGCVITHDAINENLEYIRGIYSHFGESFPPACEGESTAGGNPAASDV